MGGGAAAGLCCRGMALTPKVAPSLLAAGCAGSPSFRWGYAGRFRRRGAGVMPVSDGIRRAALGGMVLGVEPGLRGHLAGQYGNRIGPPHPPIAGGCVGLRMGCLPLACGRQHTRVVV